MDIEIEKTASSSSAALASRPIAASAADSRTMLDVEDVHYSATVHDAIKQVLPNDDPLYQADFDVTQYINVLFPSEQSLSQLDEVMAQVQSQISDLDCEIADLVQEQSSVGHDGRAALEEAKCSIQELFTRIREIKVKTEMSESMVKEITRDIKQLDVAKKNLTGSIATLHHLHILLTGVHSLGEWTRQRQYDRVANELPAMLNVLQLFEPYMSIPQVNQLAEQVNTLRSELCTQVVEDFKEALSGSASAVRSNPTKANHVLHMCRVVSVLDPKIEVELCRWYIDGQLKEYALLFDDTEDCAWLDKIEQRYRWIVGKLSEFESGGLLVVFPPEWQMLRRMAADWTLLTRTMLDRVMLKRKLQLDARLLTHAIQMTAKFESLLCKRFPALPGPDTKVTGTNSGSNAHQSTQSEHSANNHNSQSAFSMHQPAERTATANLPRTFEFIIRQVFEKYMNVFLEQQDKNLTDFINQCVQRFRDGEDRPKAESVTLAHPLQSSSRLFLFYKRAIIEAGELSTQPQQLTVQLTHILKKYLREYACRCLLAVLAKSQPNQTSTTTSSMLSAAAGGTAGLIQSFLPPAVSAAAAAGRIGLEGDNAIKLSRDDRFVSCCILCTADWCAETTQQLHEKLKEKTTDTQLHAQLDMSVEQEQFYNVSNQALMLLAQDLEACCDAAFSVMVKTNWSNREAVGDESSFVRSICEHLRDAVPLLREYLAERRKYFGHLCLKFAQQFTGKYMAAVFRCKPCSVSGAEQLLLDTHALKTFLLLMPSVGSSVAPKPPSAYVKVVTKGMTRAELILKLVMSPVESVSSFVSSYMQLLPESDPQEFQKVLEMKNIRRTEQAPLIDTFRRNSHKHNQEIMAASGDLNLGISNLALGESKGKTSPATPVVSLAEHRPNAKGSANQLSTISKLERLVKRNL